MDILLESVKPTVTSEGIFPSILFKITIRNKEHDSSYSDVRFLMAAVNLKLNGRLVASSEPILRGDSFDRGSPREFEAEIPFPRSTIAAIEAKRIDDISFQLTIEGLVSFQRSNVTHMERMSLSYPLEYSQKEWIGVLKEMGYRDAWVFEVARPDIEGMDTVAEHLEKAGDCLQRNEYKGCITHCRDAWNSFKPLLESRWDDIASLIDSSSVGQKDEDDKSIRIKNLKDKTHYWAHIGSHGEAYVITPRDSILSYHLTVSMISYLSKLLHEVTQKQST